jgi:hypothetical protein
MRTLLNWFRLRSMESSLDRELSYHLERRIQNFERSGLAAKDTSIRRAGRAMPSVSPKTFPTEIVVLQNVQPVGDLGVLQQPPNPAELPAICPACTASQ